MKRVIKKPGNWGAIVLLSLSLLCVFAFGFGVIVWGILLPISTIFETVSEAFWDYTDFQQQCVVWGWFFWLGASIFLMIKAGKWFECTDISVSVFAGIASIFLGIIINLSLVEEHPILCGAFSLLYLVVMFIFHILDIL